MFRIRIRIRIHGIHLFLDLLNPDPLARGMDPDPDPSIIKQKYKKSIGSYYFVTSFGLFILEKSFKNDVNVPSKSNKQNNLFFKLVLLAS